MGSKFDIAGDQLRKSLEAYKMVSFYRQGSVPALHFHFTKLFQIFSSDFAHFIIYISQDNRWASIISDDSSKEKSSIFQFLWNMA